MTPGRLLVLATPIGNLGDASPRLSEALGECDLLLCESVGSARRLLSALAVTARPRLVKWSLGKRGEGEERLAARLAAGETVGLLSDAGTPGIADPGQRVVSLALQAGAEVVTVPGPSAAAAALAASRWPALPATIWGFPPKGPGKTANWLAAAKGPGTHLYFVGPHRLARFLGELAAAGAEDVQALAEISKIHERRHDGPPLAVQAELPARVKGEWTLLVRFAGRN